jgi:ferredoxin-type protein NapF
MTKHISRRQFLRGDFRNKHFPVRPPWALQEDDFLDHCTRCNECVRACPQKILSSDDGGFPHVSFANGECTFCGECVSRCRDGALTGYVAGRETGRQTAWDIRAVVSGECLSVRGIHCQVCREQCEVSAIRFRPQPGREAPPEINTRLCTGCGACVKPCPVNAIHIRHPDAGQPETTSNSNQEAVCPSQV